MSGAKPRATYADLCKVPDHMVAEIVNGELFATPRPAALQALAASMVGAALIGAFAVPRVVRLWPRKGHDGVPSIRA